ncbi:Uncharacterised protein [Mycobacteroides abscessus subsp. abscessus]|nr:hypothetical protein [Mycobacterium tuberculosis]SII97325.1 Uncharacterised protein [Mycobacteroides abscessus subsp. abscessus]
MTNALDAAGRWSVTVRRRPPSRLDDETGPVSGSARKTEPPPSDDESGSSDQ